VYFNVKLTAALLNNMCKILTADKDSFGLKNLDIRKNSER